MEKTPAQEFAEAAARFSNSYSIPMDEFIQAMNSEHRTLQQAFTKLCMKWIENCASEDYRHDARNEASHKISKIMIDSFNKEQGDAYELGIANPPSKWLPMI